MGPRITDGGWGHTYLVTDVDRLWFDEGIRRCWRLGTPAGRFRRWWGIRHLRCGALALYWHVAGVELTHYEEWTHYARWKGWI